MRRNGDLPQPRHDSSKTMGKKKAGRRRPAFFDKVSSAD